MRLIDISKAYHEPDGPGGRKVVDASRLKIIPFDHHNVETRPEYAILSHTWAKDDTEEVTFQDFVNLAFRSTKPGFDEILQCCQLALDQKLEYVWIDTCCINKESSAELQEAINMMYAWYRDAKVCYVFLIDRGVNDPLDVCNWFTRGWTLQELLAPREVQFYDLLNGSTRPVLTGGRDHTRDGLASEISRITGIGERYLNKERRSTDLASVAERMSWVSQRETKKDEDKAYCMLGLFRVSLPLLYGEGWGAFRRLQEAIISKSDDESIFAWQRIVEPDDERDENHQRDENHEQDENSQRDEPHGMIASFPKEFMYSGNIRSTKFHYTRPPYAVTNRGVSFYNPARSVPGLITRWMRQSTFNGMWNQVTRQFYLRLNCEDATGRLVAIKLAPDPKTETFYRVNSSTLEYCAKERGLSRMAVLYGGYEQLYIKPPDRHITDAQQPAVPRTNLEHVAGFFHATAATVSFDNLLLCLVVQSFSCFVLAADRLHNKFRLESLSRLSVFLGWAYLTLGWKALGQNFYFWFGALAFGLVRARSPGMELDMFRREMMGALLAPGLLGVATLSYTGVRRLTWGRNMH